MIQRRPKMDSTRLKTLLVVAVVLIGAPTTCSTEQLDQKFTCRGKLYKTNYTSSSRAAKIIYHDLSKLRIPIRFDAREHWPFCKSIKHILDQKLCGGCWAFASASVMSDRLCISTKGKFNQLISPQDLMECCIECLPPGSLGGCEGGWAGGAFLHWEKVGLVTGDFGCKPINRGGGGAVLPVKQCRTFCTNPKYKRIYNNDKSYAFASVSLSKPGRSMEQLQAEIMVNGPVAAIIEAYEYVGYAGTNSIIFYDPKKVKPDETVDTVRHSIKIIGWDVVKGIPVWIMANSWGTNWCNQGFCHIRRGQNDLGIESYKVDAALPRVGDSKLVQSKPKQASGGGMARSVGAVFAVVAGLTMIYTQYFYYSIISMSTFYSFDY